MIDPCTHCEHLEARNAFLKQHWPQVADCLKIAASGVLTDSTIKPASGKLIEAIIASSNDCIFIWDKDLVCMYANAASIRQVGGEPAMILGKHMRHGLSHIPDFVDLWSERVVTVFRTGQPMQVSDTMTLLGRLVHNEATLSPVRLEDGEIFAVSIVYRDVTERKQIEQRLLEEKHKFHMLYDRARIPLFRTRVSDGKLLECNDALVKLLGYSSKEECLRRHYSTMFYADITQRKKLLERLASDGQVDGFAFEYLRLDGSRGWLEVSAWLDAEHGWIEGVQFDITAQKVLSPAEKAILALVLQGKTNKQIAQTLGRSIRTVEDHRSHIMHKLGADNLVSLIESARSLVASSE